MDKLTKKVFRMRYEPCQGTCYAWDSVFSMRQLAENPAHLDAVMGKLLKAHGPACGNRHIGYGIDYSEAGYYVASFVHFGRLDLLTGTNPTELFESLLDFVNKYWETVEGKREIQDNPGLGHGVCEHGEETELKEFVLKASGLLAA